MTLPSTNLIVLDGALGIVPANLEGVHVKLGTSSLGTNNVLVGANDPDAFVSAFGTGKMVEAGAHSLVVAGGPVYGMRVEADVVGALSTITKTAFDASTGTITDNASTPYDEYQVRLEITRTGTLGTAAFRYSLDNGDTFSPETSVPTSGDYVIGATGINLTFVPGGGPVFFESGDVHVATTRAPHYTTSALVAALDALHAGQTAFEFVHVVGESAPQFSAVTESNPAGPDITLTGTPTVFVDAIVEIMLGGVIGVATFRYSLDGGATYSTTITTAATYVIPSTGITLNFAAGTYVISDTYTWHTYTALAATAAAISAKLLEWFQDARYSFVVMETPSDISDAILAKCFENFTDKYVTVAAGDAEITSSISGALYRRSAAVTFCARLARISLSTDPAEVDIGGEGGGPLQLVTGLYRDEFATPFLDELRFTTLRTEVDAPGFYVTNGKTMAPPGSDYDLIQNVRVMNAACRAGRKALFKYQSKKIPLNKTTGLIDETFARAADLEIATFIRNSLGDDVLNVTVTVNRTDNLLSTRKLRAKIRVLPYAYAKEIEGEIGFENPALSA